MNLLAIDPGAHTGWAYFDRGILRSCGVASPDDHFFSARIQMVAIENPRIYPDGSQARPNDILTLARIVGRYQERYTGNAEYIQLVEPRGWKGTINGDVMVNRIKEQMTGEEALTYLQGTFGVAKSYAHNAVDAIGLGKWAIRQPWYRTARAKVTQ